MSFNFYAERLIDFVTKSGRNAGAFGTIKLYYKLHAEGIKFWKQTTDSAASAEDFISRIDSLEEGARALSNIVNQQKNLNSNIPYYPLLTDEQAGRMMVSQDELKYVEKYFHTAAAIANEAMLAKSDLSKEILDWRASIEQAKDTNDFTRGAVWEAIIELDQRFVNEGGSFLAYLADIRDAASKVESSAREKQYHAADILDEWTPDWYNAPTPENKDLDAEMSKFMSTGPDIKIDMEKMATETAINLEQLAETQEANNSPLADPGIHMTFLDQSNDDSVTFLEPDAQVDENNMQSSGETTNRTFDMEAYALQSAFSMQELEAELLEKEAKESSDVQVNLNTFPTTANFHKQDDQVESRIQHNDSNIEKEGDGSEKNLELDKSEYFDDYTFLDEDQFITDETMLQSDGNKIYYSEDDCSTLMPYDDSYSSFDTYVEPPQSSSENEGSSNEGATVE